jgi:hypothetical protein
MPEPITRPPRADAVLAALATHYRPGQVVTLAEICEAAGISMRSAGRVRRWALSVGRWPYADGRSTWVNWRGARSSAEHGP